MDPTCAILAVFFSLNSSSPSKSSPISSSMEDLEERSDILPWIDSNTEVCFFNSSLDLSINKRYWISLNESYKKFLLDSSTDLIVTGIGSPFA